MFNPYGSTHMGYFLSQPFGVGVTKVRREETEEFRISSGSFIWAGVTMPARV